MRAVNVIRKIAILGGSGYVGSRLVTAAKDRGLVPLSVSRTDCDIYDHEDLARYLEARGVDALINSAGYTGRPNVDACEDHKTECLLGNACLPGVVAQACQQIEIPWGHVSSGCIYTGDKDGMGFTESDRPNFSFRTDNCSFYSGSKALGEEVLADARCYIWRLRIPFDEFDGPRNYLSKLLRYERLLQARNSLTYLPEFAVAVMDCLTNQVPFGIYNVTNLGSITTRQVTQLLVDGGLTKKQCDFFESEAEFMQVAARTPRSNCVLDSSKIVAAGIRLSLIEDAIAQAVHNWQWT